MSKRSDTNYEVKLGKRQNKIYHINLVKPCIQCHAVANITLNAEDEEGADLLTFADLKGGTSDLLREQVRLAPLLCESQKDDLERIICEFEDVFSDRLGETRIIEHHIELTREEPIRGKPYRCSLVQKEIMKDEVKRMCDLGVSEGAHANSIARGLAWKCNSPLIRSPPSPKFGIKVGNRIRLASCYRLEVAVIQARPGVFSGDLKKN